MISIKPTLLLLFSIHHVLTLSITSSSPIELCSYLNDKIYCYGDFNTGLYTYSNWISLDVHTTSSAKELSSRWEVASIDEPYKGHQISSGTVMTSMDRTQLYIYHLQEGVSVFKKLNASNGSLFYFDNYQLPYMNKGKITRASASYVPSIDKVIFNGGQTEVDKDQTVIVDGISIQTNDKLLPFAFYKTTAFDPSTQEWLQIDNALNQDKDYFYSDQISVTVPSTSSVYYFGGMRTSRTNTSLYEHIEFSQLSQLTLPDYEWNAYTCTGDIPSRREGSTITLLPEQKTLLLWGQSTSIESDTNENNYCYLLDLETNVWKACPISIPQNKVPARTSHSAVLVEKHLFILFGTAVNNIKISDILILDISDINNITYVSDYVYIPPTVLKEKLIHPINQIVISTSANAPVGFIGGLMSLLYAIKRFCFGDKFKDDEEENYHSSTNRTQKKTDLETVIPIPEDMSPAKKVPTKIEVEINPYDKGEKMEVDITPFDNGEKTEEDKRERNTFIEEKYSEKIQVNNHIMLSPSESTHSNSVSNSPSISDSSFGTLRPSEISSSRAVRPVEISNAIRPVEISSQPEKQSAEVRPIVMRLKQSSNSNDFHSSYRQNRIHS
ncbi:hypothetical protein BDB01DRAFT_839146 [Pilobolus umbonatus]|nr:hypothetical protein BDB01DRAFT_839146 [Pilobolus umbonatus]